MSPAHSFSYIHAYEEGFFLERPLLRLSSFSKDQARATGPEKELGICVASRDGEKEEEKEEEASFRYFHDEKTSFFFERGREEEDYFSPVHFSSYFPGS